MRMSCNGCRVLRKGCSDDCNIRPCLEWIKSPESQAHATIFLAKFYGRAGLINLINGGPEHLRPGIFKSLLYEACGRIVNPIYGAVGLLWCGNWALCHSAVESVLKGAPITQIGSKAIEWNNDPPLKDYNIRHISKDENSSGSKNLHPVRSRRSQCQFKRSAIKPKATHAFVGSGDKSCRDEISWSSSNESSLSHQSEAALNVEDESRVSTKRLGLAQSVEASILYGAEQDFVLKPIDAVDDGEIELELTLGFEPVPRTNKVKLVYDRSDV